MLNFPIVVTSILGTWMVGSAKMPADDDMARESLRPAADEDVFPRCDRICCAVQGGHARRAREGACAPPSIEEELYRPGISDAL